MKRIKALSSIAAITILFSGCSTILTEEKHQINVKTSNGATVDVAVDGQTYQVPGIVAVQKENKNKVLMAKTDGCGDVALNKTVEGAFFINILTGGAFGSTTDFASEKMWKYQDDVTVTCN